ncbi:tetratricopeptide repeat protein [Parvicella tangerina]|uniref:Lipopolysaccharide assembly protein B n=1 Tax=Parvicella tangerina TaxID=2829795 RepID=A0A916NR36_9FLAO|nr:tetratricopeptide repeat protein [Parvicella tangerina]CAG5080370.1 Lipopolysaccharide assembly protein B [Parvicella tangerina]
MKKIGLIVGLSIVLFSCKESPQREEPAEVAPDVQEEVSKSSLDEINQEILEHPESPNGYYKRAFYYKEQFDYEKAIQDINRALKLTPDVPALTFLKADILFNQASYAQNPALYEQAEIYLLETLKLDSTHLEALVLEGRINMGKPNFEKAMANFDAALRQDKFHAPAYFYKGMVFELIGQKDNARSSYQTAIETDGSYYDALHHMGNLLASEMDEKALTYYNAALDAEPDSYEVLRNKGLFLIKLEKYEEARASFNQILSFDPNNEECYFNIGNTYVASYRDDMPQLTKDTIVQNAIDNFSKAAELNPQYIDALYNLGWMHQFRGEKKIAIDYYQKVLEIDDYHQPTLDALSDID